jgi:hypothetical protein
MHKSKETEEKKIEEETDEVAQAGMVRTLQTVTLVLQLRRLSSTSLYSVAVSFDAEVCSRKPSRHLNGKSGRHAAQMLTCVSRGTEEAEGKAQAPNQLGFKAPVAQLGLHETVLLE